MADAFDLLDSPAPHAHLGTHAPRYGTRTPNAGDDVLPHQVLGNVVVHNTYGDGDVEREDALTLLNDSAAGPNFGVGTPDGDLPAFGTDVPRFGDDDDSEDALAVLSADDIEAEQRAQGWLTVGSDDDDLTDEEKSDKQSLDHMANAVFRDLDMVLDDDSDYGDDEPGETQIGAVDESFDGSDALTILDNSEAAPNFGVGTPDGGAPKFGTHAPNYGVSDEEDDQPFVAPEPLYGEGDYSVGADDSDDLTDDEKNDQRELDHMANAVFRDLDMVLDDESDYGDDEPGETQIGADRDPREILGSDLLAIAIAAQESGFETQLPQPSQAVYDSELAQYTKRRIAQTIPIITKEPVREMRDWQLDFGGFAPAGTIMNVYATPQVMFRGENIIATDSAGGSATRVMMISVGQRSQRMNGGNGTLTTFYNQNALGNGSLWDTCQPALTIAVTVSFIQDSTFDMTVFGKCVL